MSTLFGIASGKALATKIKRPSTTIPEPATSPKYFKGYPPKKAKTINIEKMISAVDKFAGKINNNTENIGSQRGIIEALKEISLS